MLSSFRNLTLRRVLVMLLGIVLIAVVLAVNLLGDWLRDAVNPGLQ